MRQNARMVSEAQDRGKQELIRINKMHQSIETDQDFNCRDDMTAFSKSYHNGRKSKVTDQVSVANTE